MRHKSGWAAIKVFLPKGQTMEPQTYNSDTVSSQSIDTSISAVGCHSITPIRVLQARGTFPGNQFQSLPVPLGVTEMKKNMAPSRTFLFWKWKSERVLNVVRTANFELRRISSIRRLLTTEATATLVSAFILSRLDYCNSLLSGCPRSLILRLQKVQNNAARLILGISKREHISPHLASLHWLPIDYRIKYKLACICYNCMSTNSPPYLSDLLTVYTAARQLRSSSDNSVLRRPSVRTVSYGQRSFSYSAPSAWNSLPQQVRSSDKVSTFRSRTKTHLFRLAY